MSASLSLPLVQRWTLTGLSATEQGADGVPELARSAYEAMTAATWTADDAAPHAPVHEYDRARPTGDAYKAVYGYSAGARTERSSCGAVCYTFLVPADAVDQETAGACLLETLSATVSGDRYLDQGAILSAHFGATSTPPAWADVLAAAVRTEPLCATAGQTDADGAPLAPNDRTALVATATLSPGAAPLRYLHLVLRLADYLGTRGAWIEGGAFLSGPAVAATFSRAPAADETPDEKPAPKASVVSLWDPAFFPPYASSGYVDLRLWPFATWRGQYAFSTTTNVDWSKRDLATRLLVAEERLHIPGIERFYYENYVFDGSKTLYSDFNAYAARFAGLDISFGFREMSITAQKVAADADLKMTREMAYVGYVAIEGFLGAGALSRLRFDAPVAPVGCDALVCAYLVAGRPVLATPESSTQTPYTYQALVPTAAAFVENAAHLGGASQMSVYGCDRLASVTATFPLRDLYIKGAYNSPGDTFPPHTVPLAPLFTARVANGESVAAFDFDAAVDSPGWGTLVFFVTPQIGADARFALGTWNPSRIDLF